MRLGVFAALIGGLRASRPARPVAVTSEAEEIPVSDVAIVLEPRAATAIPKPKGEALQDYMHWVRKLGTDPDFDDEELQAQHAWMAARFGWSAPVAEPVPVIFHAEPTPSVQKENTPETIVVAPLIAKLGVPLENPMATLAEGRRRKLNPGKAASRFVEWVRLSGRAGTSYSSDEFRKLYLEHCNAEKLLPLGDNKLRPALEARKTDVQKDRPNKYTPLDGGGHNRHRNFHWTILPDPKVDIFTPWVELPQHQMAA